MGDMNCQWEFGTSNGNTVLLAGSVGNGLDLWLHKPDAKRSPLYPDGTGAISLFFRPVLYAVKTGYYGWTSAPITSEKDPLVRQAS
jgi:hypothetical protein